MSGSFGVLSSSSHQIGSAYADCRAYNIFSGLFQTPYFAFSQTMMAELTLPDFDNMVSPTLPPLHTTPSHTDKRTQFFGLFGLSNHASSMIGPNVIQAIINDTGNIWKGFPFLIAISAAMSLIIWFCMSSLFTSLNGNVRLISSVAVVDVTTGRHNVVAWAEKHRRYVETGVFTDEESVNEREYRKRG